MNSKQINFFILPEDLELVNKFFREEGCNILRNNVSSPDNSINYDLSLAVKEDVFQVYLTNEEFQDKIFYKYLESKNYHYIDILKSYAIEFSIGGFYPYSNKELHISRLYFNFKFFGEDEIEIKSSEFILWATNILKKFKKIFLVRTLEYPNYYFSKACTFWIKKNKAKIESDGSKFIIG